MFSRKKNINPLCFYLIFNCWQNPSWWIRWRPCSVTSQASSTSTTHKIDLILNLVEKIKGSPLEAKSFPNIATHQNPMGGGGGGAPQASTPSLCVYVRGLSLYISVKSQFLLVCSSDTSYKQLKETQVTLSSKLNSCLKSSVSSFILWAVCY